MNNIPPAFADSDEDFNGSDAFSDDFDFETQEFGEAPKVRDGGTQRPSQSDTANTTPAPNPVRPVEQRVQQPAGASPIFDDNAYAIAGRYGLSHEDVDRFESPERLDSFLGRVIQKAQQALSAQQGGYVQNPPQTGQQVPQGQRQPDASQPTQTVPFQKFDRKVFENPDLFDPEVQKTLTSVVDHYESLIEKTILPQLQQFQQRFEHQQWEAEVERFDSMVESLGESWQEVFGKGGSRSLTANTPEAQARAKVFDEMDLLADTYRHTGRPVPPQKELFDRAVRSLHSGRFQQEARQQIGSQIRDQRGRFTSRPTQREGRGLSSEERAIQFANGFRAQHMGADDDDEI